MDNNKEVTTPISGRKIVLKEFITGRDMRTLREIYLKVGKIDLAGNNVSDIDPAMVNEAESKALELVVMSVDGKTEGIIDTILDMPSQDYDFLVQAVNDITQGMSKKK